MTKKQDDERENIAAILLQGAKNSGNEYITVKRVDLIAALGGDAKPERKRAPNDQPD